jgi:protein transport protein SEC24
LHVSEVLGNAVTRPGAEVDFAIIHEDQAVAFTLDFSGEALKEGEDAYIQIAVLYTNMTGGRVVRVHNLAVAVTSSLVSIFKHADLETTTCVLKNTACRDILQPKVTSFKL